MARPFRFAVQSFSAPSATAWRDRARQVEALGYTTLHLADHILGPGPAIPSTNHPVQELAAVPAIAAAAAATETLRVGCRVFCNDYRHPVMLAKEAATLDLLSDGRLELGLGAGWLQAEYASIGLDFDPPATRIERLEETVGLIKTLMAPGEAKLSGRYVHAEGFEGAPQPVQKPHPPILIGGGSKRILSLAAREADIVSLNFNNRAGVLGPDGMKSGTAEATAEKIGWVRAAAGARFEDLELEIGAYFTFVTDDPEAIAGGMGGAMGLSAEEMLAHPHGLIGSLDGICEELERRREAYGISYVTVGDNVIEAFAPVVARLSGRA
ncbi:MAG: F420-dependent oxidoreductase [Deltaproteobacteria bacterium]|nr:F420-dependent oxidoreductase [Deltaproteobacteria bacterium]